MDGMNTGIGLLTRLPCLLVLYHCVSSRLMARRRMRGGPAPAWNDGDLRLAFPPLVFRIRFRFRVCVCVYYS